MLAAVLFLGPILLALLTLLGIGHAFSLESFARFVRKHPTCSPQPPARISRESKRAPQELHWQAVLLCYLLASC